MRAWSLALAALVVGCGDPAEFRPAKGVRDLPAPKTSYRIKKVDPNCQSLGHIVNATALDDIAETTANHGGTHFRVLDDRTSAELVTTGGRGAAVGHSRSSVATHHRFTAEAYRCD